MPMFAVLDIEGIVQENDKTRLDASKSYATGDVPEITTIEIQPEADADFFEVGEEGVLDWQYEFDPTPVDGKVPDTNTRAVTVRLTYQAPTVAPDPAPAPVVKTLTKNIVVISEAADMLFATDEMLRKHEGDIMRYVYEGRATFKDVHRRAQELILAWLDRESFVDDIGNKLTKKRLADTTQLNEWATMMALRLIFESVTKDSEDVYRAKASKYQGLEDFYRDRAVVYVKPTNSDADIPEGELSILAEPLDIRSCRVVRR